MLLSKYPIALSIKTQLLRGHRKCKRKQ